MTLSIEPGSKIGLRLYVALALLAAVPTFAVAQHKNSPPPHGSAPAPHASAPPHNSAPPRPAAPQQHSNMPSHNGMGSPTHTAGPGSMGAHGNSNMGTTHANTNANVHNGNMANTHGGVNNSAPPGAANTHNTGNLAGHNTGNMAGPTAGNMAGHNANNAAAHAGNVGHNGPGGHVAGNRTPPGHQVSLRGGGTAHIRPNGQIRSVNRNGMHIEHGLHGGRTVVSTHNGARVVTTGHGGGYVQRNYVVRNGNTYVSRTYVVNNVSYTSVYRSYGYGGYCCYYGYAPAYYYNPGYYGWAYNPWPAPVYYGWGWQAEPWYGYYGPYYYQPYPVYPSAAFWLTDYLIAASLRASYEASVEADALDPLGPDFLLVAGLGRIPVAPDAPKNVVLSKGVKDQLAEEVKAQLAADQADA